MLTTRAVVIFFLMHAFHSASSLGGSLGRTVFLRTDLNKGNIGYLSGTLGDSDM